VIKQVIEWWNRILLAPMIDPIRIRQTCELVVLPNR